MTHTDSSTMFHDAVCIREHPPNGQGIAALIALKILDGITEPGPIGGTDYNDPSRAHHLIEAVRLGKPNSVCHIVQERKLGDRLIGH